MTPQWLSRLRELTTRFDAFYRVAIRRYYTEPEGNQEFLVNPLLQNALARDNATDNPLPAARFDCVLTAKGELRVIEVNPVGVCTIHLQNAGFTACALWKAGLREAAVEVDSLYRAMGQNVLRFYRETAAEPAPTPRVGLVVLANFHRGARVLWRDLFRRMDIPYVEGRVRDLEISPRGLRLKGQEIDLFWGDFVFFQGYQFERYKKTRWGSRLTDFSQAPAVTERVIGNPTALDLFIRRKVVQLSPPQAYLGLSKHLLSYIHRPEVALKSDDRRWLTAHVAETFSARDRAEGRLTLEEALRNRGEFVLKPCLYGGSHGVVAGRELTNEDWEQRVRAAWSDPEWVLQAYYEPARRSDGQWLSIGLYSYGGVFGGMTIRAAPSLIISARKSMFIPVAIDV
jgi:hypothetical protein